MNPALLPLALTAALLFAGCAGGTPRPGGAAVRTAMPAWYLHPPANDAQFLYGVGEGETMEEAKRHALADLAERLRVTVASRYRSVERSRDDGYEFTARDRTHTVDTETGDIALPDAEILRSRPLAWNRYAVLVGVEKRKVAKELEEKVGRALERADRRWEAARDAPPLVRWFTARDNRAALTSRLKEARTLDALKEGSRTAASFMERLARYEAAMEAIRRKTTLCLDAPKGPFAEAVVSAVREAGWKTAVSKGCEGSPRLKVRTRRHPYRSYGFYLLEGTADVTLSARNGQPLVSRRERLKGASSQSADAALADAVRRFDEALRRNPLF